MIIVVINYFSAEESLALISSILEQNIPSLKKVICADNSCNDAEFDKLSSYSHKLLDVQKNTENLGFGRAINKSVANEIFDSLLLINPDVELCDNAIQLLLQAKENLPEQRVWGGLTVSVDGEPDFYHAWRKPSLLRELSWALGLSSFSKNENLVNHYRYQDCSKDYEVDAVSGCFLLIDGDLWKELQGFDEQFFLYSEEMDLCARARNLGSKPLTVVNAKLKHERGVSSANEFNRLFLMFSSKLLFWKKHGGLLKSTFVRSLYVLSGFLRAVIFLFIPRKANLSKTWAKLSFSLLFNKTVNESKGEL